MEGGNNSREGGNFSLIDIPLEGVNFTWSNSREVESKAWLDRFLFTGDWEAKFPTVC